MHGAGHGKKQALFNTPFQPEAWREHGYCTISGNHFPPRELWVPAGRTKFKVICLGLRILRIEQVSQAADRRSTAAYAKLAD
jgi:hypothetical protein